MAEIEDEFDAFLKAESTEKSNVPSEDIKAKQIEKEDNYKRSKTEIQESVEELQGNINAMLKEIDTPLDNMIPDDKVLPNLVINIENHDYDRDIEVIKIDARDTLNCLANLYIDEETMKNKNIYKIIKDDSNQLADLNFSISCSKRALINCMKQLDMGVIDPEMYESVALFQKELRESINSAYSLQKKMKEFYKELRDELGTVNVGQDILKDLGNKDNDTYTVIGDPKLLNDLFEKYKTDPTFLSELENQVKKETNKE